MITAEQFDELLEISRRMERRIDELQRAISAQSDGVSVPIIDYLSRPNLEENLRRRARIIASRDRKNGGKNGKR